MEAVWKRIILLLIAGVILTTILFPIVRGEPRNGRREPIDRWVSSEIIPVLISPEDTSIPPDNRIDLHEGRIEEFFFVFRLIVDDQWINHGQPISNGKVWLNITMGEYTNSSFSLANSLGIVFFRFTSRLRDTDTGNSFSIPAEDDQANLTMQVIFPGKFGYTSSIHTIYCTFHRGPIEEGDIHSDPNIICSLMGVTIPIMMIFSIIMLSIWIERYFSIRKDRRFYQKQMKYVKNAERYPETIHN